MQDVKLCVGDAARAHLFHTQLVLITPCVSEGIPIDGISERLQDQFRIAGDPGPPINESTEDVEKQCLDSVWGHGGQRFRPYFRQTSKARPHARSRYARAEPPRRKSRRGVLVMIANERGRWTTI